MSIISGVTNPPEGPSREQPQNVQQQVTANLKSLGDWRDGALVLAGIFYASGYLVWSLNAIEHNLGLLPALQLQYFVAGIGPVLIMLIAGGGGLWLWRIMTTSWVPHLEEGRGSWGVVQAIFKLLIALPIAFFATLASPTLALIMLLLLAAGLLFNLINNIPPFLQGLVRRMRILPFDELPTGKQLIRLLVLVGFFGGLIWLWTQHASLDAIVIETMSGKIDMDSLETIVGLAFGIGILFGPPSYWGPLHKAFRVFYFLLFVVGFALISLFFYTERIYARLPQELGGARPRCAFVDVEPAGLAAETRDALLPGGDQGEQKEIVHSVQLDVLFSSGSVLMVQPATGTGADVVFELPRSQVQAITWCR